MKIWFLPWIYRKFSVIFKRLGPLDPTHPHLGQLTPQTIFLAASLDHCCGFFANHKIFLPLTIKPPPHRPWLLFLYIGWLTMNNCFVLTFTFLEIFFLSLVPNDMVKVGKVGISRSNSQPNFSIPGNGREIKNCFPDPCGNIRILRDLTTETEFLLTPD